MSTPHPIIAARCLNLAHAAWLCGLSFALFGAACSDGSDAPDATDVSDADTESTEPACDPGAEAPWALP